MAEAFDPTRVYSDPLAQWFVTDAYRITDTAELVKASGEKLVEAGIPLYRLAYFQRTLHPELAGTAYMWRRGRGIEVGSAPHGLFSSPQFLDNPLPRVYAERKTIRVRIEEQNDLQAPILRQLKEEGATDYVALPLFFTTDHIDALSVVSDAPGGFSRRDLERMYQLQFAFTRIVEVHSLRDTAINLLDAYVGHAAGERILRGEVKRGDGETIDAVIWFSDLRGFTRLSDHLPRTALIALLNEYFGALAKAVADEAGEILKFMGDGMLAMFPAAAAGRGDAAARAVRAARAASAATAALNRERTAKAEPPMRFGIALHVGEVMFGNIGASHRLDFTVIGPAVNHAARLEKLSATIEQPIVLSAELAALLPAGEAVPLGEHQLKDIDAPRAVFGLSGPGVVL
jgi:adenylate cyclase